MKQLRLVALLLFSSLILPLIARAQTTSYSDVMLIVNDRSWASKEIGSYFAARRGIADDHICHIDVDSSETMDSATFKPLQWQIEKWMKDNKLVNAINYIVTTKGCPLRIRTKQWDVFDTNGNFVAAGGQSSFEDCLVLINGSDSVAMLAVKTQSFYKSRYFGSSDRFRRNPTTMPMYLVTRLDAYTVDQVKSYIRRAEQPPTLGDGLWVLDIDPGRDKNAGYRIGNDWLRNAATTLTDKRLNILLNTDTVYLHNQQNVIGYGSWGSNDGHSGGGEAAKPGNTWMDCSIAETFVSTGGRSFTSGTGYGQSLVADWLAEGVCAVKGYTDEPYLTSMAHPDLLFDRYTSGFYMAESYYAASELIGWRQVVIGDPKMHLDLRQLTVTPDTIRFMQTTPGQPVTMMATLSNRTQSVPLVLYSTTLSGSGSAQFRIDPSVKFPLTIQGEETVEIPVIYTPSSGGVDNAVLTVRSTNADNGAIPIVLLGTDAASSVDAPTGPLAPTEILSSTPNPFSSRTEIRYRVGAAGAKVQLDIVDMLGRSVIMLIDRFEPTGERSVTFDATNLPSGTYLCRLSVTDAAGTETVSKSLLHSR